MLMTGIKKVIRLTSYYLNLMSIHGECDKF